jgi:hypothetical protein
MSFRLFIYYCAVCGGSAAFLGWGLGRLLAPEAVVARALVQGVLLGGVVALGVGLADALGGLSGRPGSQAAGRVLAAAGVGCVGGFLGALTGQLLVRAASRPGGALESVFGVVGWTVTGLAVGASVGTFDLLASLSRAQDPAGARRKVVHGLLGGALGGLVGGSLHLALRAGLSRLFPEGKELISPGAFGFVALGVSIGLLTGLAQVILKEAWVRVESGFRAGRELILSKPETTVGRSEACDIGLFGDPAVASVHARILAQGRRYVLADGDGAGGTFLNDRRVTQPAPLRSGDRFRVGGSVLSFGERQRAEPRP